MKSRDKSNRTYRYSVNFTPEENARFLTMFEKSGVYSNPHCTSISITS
ncbi:MAG: hypothetical protein ACK5IJ_07285 [Mangrovibacterium sp.]